jgi:Phosphopantetheine attachment site.
VKGMEKIMNKEIREIVINLLELENIVIDDEQNLVDIGMDSLIFVKMIVELEIKYDIEVDVEDLVIEKFNTITKISEYILERK